MVVEGGARVRRRKREVEVMSDYDSNKQYTSGSTLKTIMDKLILIFIILVVAIFLIAVITVYCVFLMKRMRKVQTR